MSDLKRDLIKYCRDRAKSGYKKENSCRACGSSENLQLHHFSSMTMLLEKWMRKNKITINSVAEIMQYRDDFIDEHRKEIYEDVVTLCKSCHMEKLHGIYGQKPSLGTALKQARWVEKQRVKNGLV